jgi:hypothetical protein
VEGLDAKWYKTTQFGADFKFLHVRLMQDLVVFAIQVLLISTPPSLPFEEFKLSAYLGRENR